MKSSECIDYKEPQTERKRVMILFQSADFVRVIDLDTDEERAIPKSCIHGNPEIVSGKKVELLVDPSWKKIFFLNR